MIRKNKTNPHPHLYRIVIPDAFRDAWSRRYVWPLALFAGLLYTGGIYDVLLTTFREAGRKSLTVTTGGIPPVFSAIYESFAAAPDTITALGLVQSITIAVLIVSVIVGLSVICQGALAFGLGGLIRGRAPLFGESLTIGARYASRVLALNIVTLFLGWLAKFFFLVPYGLSQTNPVTGLGVIAALGALFYAVSVVALAAIHLFALNAIILQDAHVAESLHRAWFLLRRGWLNTLEIGTILFLVGAGILAAGAIAFMLMALPIFLLMAAAALMNSTIIVYIGFILFVSLFFITTLIAGMLAITFQYAAWHRLFIRLGEGGALPKIHRWWLSLSRSIRA